MDIRVRGPWFGGEAELSHLAHTNEETHKKEENTNVEVFRNGQSQRVIRET